MSPATPDDGRSREADVQLVAAAQNGDREAFGQLVEHYRGRIYAMAMAITADPHEAQELTQETFIRALKNLPRLDAPEKFHPWLRGIAHTIGRDIRRKAARERRHLEAAAQERPSAGAPADASVADGEAQSAELVALGAELATLPENTRVALDLRFREGLSYEEIGQIMGVPSSTVRGLLHRGTKALREKLRPTLKRTRGS
jgi:RNA polymerase sigma-70 factor, ECF subfamily